MTDQVTRVRVFVSSPSDVERERDDLRKVIDGLNETLGHDRGIVIELVRWETHVTPGMGRPQQVINDQIGPYDVFVGIMWKRFGRPTGEAESGTKEEFDLAFKSWKDSGRPQLLFYFSQQPFMPQGREDLDQCGKVFDFRDELRKKGIVRNYRGVEEFADAIRAPLYRAISDSLPVSLAPTEEIVAARHSERQVIFSDDFEIFSGWQQLGHGRVEQSTEQVRSGRHALKKDGESDPNGGFKLIGRPIGRGFVFSGWLFHPARRTGGVADRLAIEDDKFNGYGFMLTDSCTRLRLERRVNRVGRPFGEALTVSLKVDTWYRFAFYVRRRTLTLILSDAEGKELARIVDVSDSEFQTFDRVAIHGGTPYFVDELAITILDH